MKSVLLVFAVLTVSSYIACANAQKTPTVDSQYTVKITGAWATCKAENAALTDEEFERMTTKPSFPTTRNEKCFKLCFAKQMGYMKDNGEVDASAVKEGNKHMFANNPDMVAFANNVFDQCNEEMTASSETDACEKAGAFCSCMMRNFQSVSQSLPVMDTSGKGSK